MKKIFALLLAGMMVAAMAACGNTNSGTDSTTDNPPAEATKTDGPSDTADFVRGVWTDGVYANDFLNLKFTNPDGWTAAADQEIAEIMGLATEYSEGGTAFSEAYAKAQNVYDMMTSSTADKTSVIIMAENLALSVGGTSYDEKAYADTVSQQLVAQTDIHYEAKGTEEINIGSTPYLMMSMSVNDGVMNQYYLMRRVGKYMATVIISCPASVDVSTLLPQFANVK